MDFFLNVRIIAEQAIPFGNHCKSELTKIYFLISRKPPKMNKTPTLNGIKRSFDYLVLWYSTSHDPWLGPRLPFILNMAKPCYFVFRFPYIMPSFVDVIHNRALDPAILWYLPPFPGTGFISLKNKYFQLSWWSNLHTDTWKLRSKYSETWFEDLYGWGCFYLKEISFSFPRST